MDRTTIAEPVRQLLDEHAMFMRALEDLVDVTSTIDPSLDSIDPEKLDALQRLVDDVDEHLNVHFVKEEEVFFPALERHFPAARVRFQFLHVDHDRLRETFELFIALLQNARHHRLEPSRFIDLTRLASEMVRLFYYHIVAEDSVYLDVATELLTAEESDALGERMHALENRLRECCGASSSA